MMGLLEACGSAVHRLSPGITSNQPALSTKRVLCVGLCTLDVVQTLNSYPIEDSDQKCLESRWQRGGNASNNCSVLSQLGQNCEFFGTLCKENHFSFLAEDFNKYGIMTENCIYHSNCETPTSTIILSLDSGSRTIVHSNPSLPELKFEEFKRLNLKNYSWVHFEGRNEKEVTLMMEYVEHWNSVYNKDLSNPPITISLDLEKPRSTLLDLLPYADVIFIGKDFAKSRNCTNMSETLKNIAKDTKIGATIICAWSDRGAMARGPDGVTVQSPAFPPRQIIDTLGAGDTFCATVVCSLSRGKTLQESISFGCQIAGAKVGQRGFSYISSTYEKNHL